METLSSLWTRFRTELKDNNVLPVFLLGIEALESCLDDFMIHDDTLLCLSLYPFFVSESGLRSFRWGCLGPGDVVSYAADN